jgi:OOP family OmpA-OmpF porin
MKPTGHALLLLAAATLGGCANEPMETTTVIVVPTESGHVGTVVMNPGAEQIVLHEPYVALSAAPNGGIREASTTAKDVERIFHDAKEAKPSLRYTVYFDIGEERLTPDAEKILAKAAARVPSLHPSNIVVTGHTDRLGHDGGNLELSAKRAELARDFLVGHGVSDKLVHASGRGEREPAVPTVDGAYEPLNRRVEIELQK